MAKEALLGVLQSTIGKYVLDLDAEKLNLGIWSGKVELHDLQLDVNACNGELDRQAAEAPNLAIPLKVVGGKFQSILMEIPWTRLTDKSVVMKAQGLHIHVAPHDRLQETDFLKLAVSSEDKRAQHIQQQRAKSIELSNQNRLHKLELMKLTELSAEDDDEDGKDDKKSGTSFVARLVKRIVENLQVEINDVQVTIQGKEGTAGMVLENLSFVTTDMAGHRTFVDRTDNSNPSDLLNKFLYKKLQIKGFALYVEDPAKEGEESSAHKYVLDPLNFEATLREADVSITQDYPRWLMKSKVPAVQLGYSQIQYQQTMGLLAQMAPSPHAARPLFPEYRPLHRVTAKSAKDWWQYAYRCVGRLTGRQSWMTFYNAFKARKTYVALYKRKAHADTAPWLKPLTIEEEADLKQLEEDRSTSVEGIMIWRNFADGQVEKERAKRQEQETKKKAEAQRKGGMLYNLFGGSDNSTDTEEDTPIALSVDELKELENVGMEEMGNELSSDAKLCKVEFVLGEFRIHLQKGLDQPMMGLEMGRVSSSFEADAGGSFSFSHSLQSFEILDHLHSSSLFPRIVRSLGGEGTSNPDTQAPQKEDVFQVQVSMNKKKDKKLSAKLIPFEAVFAPHLMTELMEFLKLPGPNEPPSTPQPMAIEEGDADDDDLTSKKRTEPSTSTTSADLSNALVDAWHAKTKEKTSLCIDLNLQAPMLVLPENCSDPKASVIVLDLGGFRFRYGFSDDNPKVTQWLADNPRDTKSQNPTNSQESLPATGTVIDHGCMELENMTFLVGEAQRWRTSASMREKESIIAPISVKFDFAVESVVGSSIPRTCIFTSIADNHFKFAPNHLLMSLRVYNAWMSALESIRGKGSSASPPPDPVPEPHTDKRESTRSSLVKRNSAIEIAANDAVASDEPGSEDVVQIEMEELSKTVAATLADDDKELFTTVYFEMTTETYSCVVYDAGEFQSSEGFNSKDSVSGLSSPLANIAEGLAMEGRIQCSLSLATDKNGTTSTTSVEVKGQEFEIYSGFGRELRRPLQILEPVTAALKLSYQRKGAMTNQTDLKAKCHEGIDLTFSMRSMALMKAISSELSECLRAGLKETDEKDEPMEILDEETTHQIEAMASALESDNIAPAGALSDEQEVDTIPGGINKKRASSSIVTLDAKIPKSKLTIINDLQGLDEALFRIELDQFVTKGSVARLKDVDDASLTQTSFDIRQHTIILADYFDPSVNSWKPLLQKPWQLEFKSARKLDKTSKSGRFNTRADIHFWPLHLSFSEHFLIGLGAASRMLSMSAELERESRSVVGKDRAIRASTTRNLVAALPYALDNFSGVDVEFLLAESQVGNRHCPNGTKKYFKFNPPKGRGHGGKRLYGEDVKQDLSIKVFIGENDTIEMERIDDDLGKPKRCHILKDGTMLVTTVVKEGLSTVIRLSSNMYMRNRTPIPTRIAVLKESGEFNLGLVEPTSSLLDKTTARLVPYDLKDGTLSKPSLRLGIRFPGQAEMAEKWGETGKGRMDLQVSPLIDGVDSCLQGTLTLEADIQEISAAENSAIHLRVDVVCTATDPDAHEFVLQAAVKMQLVGGKKLVTYISLEPRAMLVSTIPLRITVLTRLPHCYSAHSLAKPERKDTVHTIHELGPGGKIEVYSGGDTLGVKLRLTDNPCNGTPTGTSRQWIQVPLSSEMEKPTLCLLPFIVPEDEGVSKASPGSEFFIAEATPMLPEFFLERINDDGQLSGPADSATQSTKQPPKTFLFTVASYGIDHTNSILFEQLVGKSKGFFQSSIRKDPAPFGAFTESTVSEHRLTLLPTSEIPIRLALQGPSGTRRTALFRVEEVSMSKGGAQATPIVWDDGTESGYFAYRQLVTSFQSELHVIPEFLVFNGSSHHEVIVRQEGGKDVTIAPNDSAPIFAVNRSKGLPLSFHYSVIGGATKSLRLEELGLHIELVQTAEGMSLGSLAVQTSIGSEDSRLLIKLGEVGEIEKEPDRSPIGMILPASFGNDTLRFRIHAEEFAVTLNQPTPNSADDDQATLEMAGNHPKSARKRPPNEEKSERPTLEAVPKLRMEKPICTMLMERFIYDVQKLFKEKEDLASEDEVPERCQLSLIIHNFAIRDETPRSPFPDVFSYTGKNRFLDICVRTKGPLHDRNVKVDLFDLVLAHSGQGDEQSQDKIYLQTSENFVWKLIDTANRISQASKEPTDKGDFDVALASYVPKYSKEVATRYAPPQVATIYDIAVARVSPFNIIVSFRRNPEADRYDNFINSEGAHLMRYFTQQLKFTIDKCDLRFARYEETELKGPRDRLKEILTAVYISRMKLKVVTILAAASFGDWKDLAARDDGDDEFVDGDLLRVTGSVAGNSVAFAFNKVGKDLGSSVTMGIGAIGDGVENGAALLGAKSFGTGINTVISGVGGFAGGTLQGVGEGAGALFKGAGEGLGHFFGGITGGGSRIVKGVGKSITTGDGGAMATGLKEGFEHLGSGLQNSAKAVGTGVTGSVTNVVRGSVTGVRTSVNSVSVRSSNRSHASDLAKIREEFKDQDYS